jgi:cytochrome c-type biogenesis protein CcmF
MVTAHLGIAVALFGMASDSAFTAERLVALAPGGTTEVGPWQVTFTQIAPVAGPNWTALEARLEARLGEDGEPVALNPQSRSFWAPEQQTTESALATRWNGQLYAVIGGAADDGRWQIRLWWKPFVTLIWYGGLLVAIGGVLSLLGRVSADVKRRHVRSRMAARRKGWAP